MACLPQAEKNETGALYLHMCGRAGFVIDAIFAPESGETGKLSPSRPILARIRAKMPQGNNRV